MSDDQRKFKRVPIKAVVIYRVLDHLKVIQKRLRKIGNPLSVDISIGGLQIITRQKLPKDIELKIELSILSSGTPIEVYGKVAWIENDSTPGQFRAGVKFTKYPSEEHQLAIKKFIEMRG